jgi:predicted phage-related endonuclease
VSLTAKQIEIRRSGITSSDVRVIVGEDPYSRTVHDVFASKIYGLDSFRETEATRLGTALEPVVIAQAAERLNRTVRVVPPDEMTVRHREHAHHIATPDALFENVEDEGLEVKVVGLHQQYEWGDSGIGPVPDGFVIQCTWQAYVKNWARVHLAALLGTEIRLYIVERDPDLEGVLVEQVDRFRRDHILTRVPPEIDGSAGARRMLKARWPSATETLLQANIETEQQARIYFDAKRQIDALEATRELAAQKIIQYIGSNGGVKGDGWRCLYGLRAAQHYTVDKAPYRHFDCRAIKGKKT